jgi:hypothetical protein
MFQSRVCEPEVRSVRIEARESPHGISRVQRLAGAT